MASQTFTIEAADTPTLQFMAYSDFDLSLDMEGSNVVALQRYIGGVWRTAETYEESAERVIRVASGMAFRLLASTFDTEDITVTVNGEINPISV